MLLEALKEYCERTYSRTPRNQESYAATAAYVEGNINRLIDLYRQTQNNEQTKRLIRDDIDNSLRRYHGYCIKENIGAHYVERGLTGTGVFEHMVPLSTIRDLLLAGIITPKQGCNMPMCRLSKEKDDLLRENKMASRTPDIYNFWKRYEYCFEVDGNFTTYDGNEVVSTMTLDDHFKWLGI